MSLETTIFDFKMLVKSSLEFPSIFKLAFQTNSAFQGRFILYWAAATLKGLGEFQNKKILGHFSPSFSAINVNFKTRYFSPLIE